MDQSSVECLKYALEAAAFKRQMVGPSIAWVWGRRLGPALRDPKEFTARIEKRSQGLDIRCPRLLSQRRVSRRVYSRGIRRPRVSGLAWGLWSSFSISSTTIFRFLSASRHSGQTAGYFSPFITSSKTRQMPSTLALLGLVVCDRNWCIPHESWK